MSGIRPRIAPAQTYGVVGTSIYSDIIDGASQLMGIVQQGRQNTANNEFRREGMDMQEDQFEADEKQRGIANKQADRRTDLAEDQFNQQKIDSWVNNTIKGMENGFAAPTNADELKGIPAAEGIVSKTTQIGNQVQVVDAIQQTLDLAYTTGEGKAFNQKSLDRLTPALAKALNPGGENKDFELKSRLNENGTISFSVDKQTYETLDEQSKGIFSVIGSSTLSREDFLANQGTGAALPGASLDITPDMLSTHLSQEIGELNNLGKYGMAAANQKMAAFSKNESTSPQAQLLAVRKQKSASATAAYSKTTRANERISRLATTWIRNGDGVDPAAASQAETQAQGDVNAAYADYQDALGEASSFDEISKANREYNTKVTKASANFASRAGDALQWSDYERAVVGASDTGALNQLGYSKQGKVGWTYTKGEAKEATKLLVPKMTAQFDAEAREPFVEVEMKKLRSANPSLSSGVARDQANLTFNEKRTQFTSAANIAAADGKAIDSEVYEFMMTYAKPMLGALQNSNASSYLPRQDEEEVVKRIADNEMANTYK